MFVTEPSDRDTFGSGTTVDRSGTESDTVVGAHTSKFKTGIMEIYQVAPAESDTPPEGGPEAWLVLLGSFLDLLSTFGVVNSYVKTHRGATSTLI